MNEPRTPLQPNQPAPTLPRTGQPPMQQPGIARPGIATAAPGIAPRPAMAPQAHPPQQLRPGIAPGVPGQTIPRPGVAPALNPAARPHTADQAIALDEEIVDLEADGSASATPVSKIKFGAEVHRHHDWKRQPNKGGTGACRVRTFHGKLSDQGLEYIDEAINIWLDDHPEIDIKFVTTNVGMFDGKFKDLALVVNVWY